MHSTYTHTELYYYIVRSYWVHFLSVKVSGNPLIGHDVGTGDSGKLGTGKGVWSQMAKTFGSQGMRWTLSVLACLVSSDLQMPYFFSSLVSDSLHLQLIL